MSCKKTERQGEGAHTSSTEPDAHTGLNAPTLATLCPTNAARQNSRTPPSLHYTSFLWLIVVVGAFELFKAVEAAR